MPFTEESIYRFQNKRLKLCKLYCERDLNFEPVLTGDWRGKCYSIRPDYQDIFTRKVAEANSILIEGETYKTYEVTLKGIEDKMVAEGIAEHIKKVAKKAKIKHYKTEVRESIF